MEILIKSQNLICNEKMKDIFFNSMPNFKKNNYELILQKRGSNIIMSKLKFKRKKISYKFKYEPTEYVRILDDTFLGRNKKKFCLILVNKEYKLFSRVRIDNYFYSIKLKAVEMVTNLSKMFYNCDTLMVIPEIYNFNTKYVKDMSWMFCNCTSLKKLPKISNWNISNVGNMSMMFSNCCSKEFP